MDDPVLALLEPRELHDGLGVVESEIVYLAFHRKALVLGGEQGLPQELVPDQQLVLQLVSRRLHGCLTDVLLPLGEVLQEPVLAEELQTHQLGEEQGLLLPPVQRHEPGVLLAEIGHAPRAYRDVLVLRRH